MHSIVASSPLANETSCCGMLITGRTKNILINFGYIRLLEEANSHDQLNMTDNWLEYDPKIRTMMNLNN